MYKYIILFLSYICITDVLHTLMVAHTCMLCVDGTHSRLLLRVCVVRRYIIAASSRKEEIATFQNLKSKNIYYRLENIITFFRGVTLINHQYNYSSFKILI